MSDPREDNARVFKESGGKITGVKLEITTKPGSKYELIKAGLIDENAAQGTTIARIIVKDKDGIDAQVHCWMAWPWKGDLPGSWDGKGLPGNANYPYQHIITNAYNPGSQPGPLAIYIGDAHGNIESDVVGGLGLPGGHHVGYHLVYRERSMVTGPVIDVEVEEHTTTQPDGDILERLQRMEEKLDRIAERFGI